MKIVENENENEKKNNTWNYLKNCEVNVSKDIYLNGPIMAMNSNKYKHNLHMEVQSCKTLKTIFRHVFTSWAIAPEL